MLHLRLWCRTFTSSRVWLAQKSQLDLSSFSTVRLGLSLLPLIVGWFVITSMESLAQAAALYACDGVPGVLLLSCILHFATK